MGSSCACTCHNDDNDIHNRAMNMEATLSIRNNHVHQKNTSNHMAVHSNSHGQNQPSMSDDNNEREMIDLSIFDHHTNTSHKSQTGSASKQLCKCKSSNLCSAIVTKESLSQKSSLSSNNLKQRPYIKRILTLLKYYSMLKPTSDREGQRIFVNFINTVYNTSELIMDHFHLYKKHDHQIQDITNLALTDYKIPPCDIRTCPHSSRLYRTNDASTDFIIFDKDDKESLLPVTMDIIDGIHHYIFHVTECGLRITEDDESIDNIDCKEETNEYYDPTYARIREKVKKSRIHTKGLDRINNSHKFNIIVGHNHNDHDSYINENSL